MERRRATTTKRRELVQLSIHTPFTSHTFFLHLISKPPCVLGLTHVRVLYEYYTQSLKTLFASLLHYYSQSRQTTVLFLLVYDHIYILLNQTRSTQTYSRDTSLSRDTRLPVFSALAATLLRGSYGTYWSRLAQNVRETRVPRVGTLWYYEVSLNLGNSKKLFLGVFLFRTRQRRRSKNFSQQKTLSCSFLARVPHVLRETGP